MDWNSLQEKSIKQSRKKNNISHSVNLCLKRPGELPAAFFMAGFAALRKTKVPSAGFLEKIGTVFK